MEFKGGYMKLYHEFRDYIIKGNFTCNELKILLTVDSLMYGYSNSFKINQKMISENTGISKDNVSKNIKKLIKSNHILINNGCILLNEDFIKEEILKKSDKKTDKSNKKKVVKLTTQSCQIDNHEQSEKVVKLTTQSCQINNSKLLNQQPTLLNIEERRKEEISLSAFSDKKNKENEEQKLEEMFVKFWDAYRTKNGKDKKKAKEIFKRINPDDSLLKKMLEAIENQQEERKILKRKGEFAPVWKMAKTWLYGECWTDEVSVQKKRDYTEMLKRLESDGVM